MVPIDEAQREMLSTVHRNSFFQIILLRQGQGRYFVGLEQFSISAPAIFFIFPRQISSLELSEDAQGDLLMFDESIFCSAILANELKEYNIGLHQRVNFLSYEGREPLFEDILRSKQQIDALEQPLNNIREIERKFFCKIIILKIIDSAPPHDFQGVEDADLGAYISFRKLVDEQFSSERHVESYCQSLGVSAKKLNLLCKKFAQSSPLKLIHDRLSTEIKKMLIFEEMPMKEIAYSLGFESQSALNKYILSKFDCNPSQLKEKLREEASMISSRK